jgi:tRNA(adenine34) deaminase
MTGPFDAPMRIALAQAAEAATHGDVPVGAVVVGPAGDILGVGRNRREADADPVAHAEVLALRAASATLGRWRLDDCTLVVTLEPCVMCAGALLAARIPRLVIGAWDAKAGATGSQWDLVRDARVGAKVEVVSGVLATESAELLRAFFEQRR